MNTNRIFGISSVVGLIALVAFGIFAVAGGLGGSDSDAKTADQAREASCLAGSTDCDDTGGDGALGLCAADVDADGCDDTFDQPVDGGISQICLAPEEGVETDEAKPCVDTPTDGGFEQICASDMPDCVDSGGGSDGYGAGSGSTSPGYAGCGTPEECQRAAIEAALAALEFLNGTTGETITSTSAKAVEWPNSCLGVSTPNIACAEVITPGYIVILDTGLLGYEFHTDLSGIAILAEPAQ